MDSIVTAVDGLTIPVKARQDLAGFVKQIVDLYGDDLLSIIAFGSSVTGEFDEKRSDLNLLVVYSELNITDLHKVAAIAQKWERKRNFAPRFLSRRNLVDSARYFPVDLLHIKNQYRLLYGKDITNELPLNPADLHWQVAHEVKKMRMRIKQQFWRASGNPAALRRVLSLRASSIIHLLRAMLYMKTKTFTGSSAAVIAGAGRDLGLDAAVLTALVRLRDPKVKCGAEELLAQVDAAMQIIRAMDAANDGLRP